ncbi:unnamed protein product [Urochloa decumbens]|uniref:Protein kinase domain-containing protein n=1 Tax=Urochloa decumbens TaxID=240449 RepID=A0ABC8XD91_9POAL
MNKLTVEQHWHSMAIPADPTLHLLQLLLVLAAAATLVASADEEQLPITLPHCQDKCGNISIPYPFGINAGCFLQGFEVVCNGTFEPPRLFLAADNPISLGPAATRPYMVASNYYYTRTDKQLNEPNMTKQSRSPVEVMDISVSQGHMRIHGTFSFDCRENRTYHSSRVQIVYLPKGSPFLFSEERNVLLVIGRRVEATMPLNRETTLGVRTAGRCLGKGWCQGDIQVNTRSIKVQVTPGSGANDTEWQISPCSYGMAAEDSWYSFSPQDLNGDSFLRRNDGRGVPVVLLFTVRGVECPAEGEPEPSGYACVSNHSECVDGPILPSHYCTCSDGFHGNPYIANGCQDIDECKHPDYPCHGKCNNKPGNYDCTCPPGMRGDAKAGPCTDIFPLSAKVSLGAMGGLFLVAALAFPILIHREKRKMREFFERNGGPTLEKAKQIKIYKMEELKSILKPNNFIGKGGFGEVYKGLLDNELVAVKKPIISDNMAHNEQFANEVIIQSQVSHKNIVRLKGCCLEVDIPMLVYEFLTNGSLHDILHGDNKMLLNWDTRLSIAAESADGLAYMHSKVNNKILHGDVKPANILLTDDFAPKISDFGISRLILREKQHTGWIVGDMSYMDPIFLQRGLLTEKSDVYSFGVLLLELISRRKATHADNDNIVSDFLEAYNNKDKGATEELFDKEIATESNIDDLNTVAGIAMECLNLDVDKRPVMTSVAERLLTIRDHVVTRMA